MGVLIIYALLGMFCSEFWLATLVLLTTAIPLVLSGKIAQRSEPQKTRVLEQEKIYSQKIREILSGYLTIKTYQVEAQLLKIYHRSLQKYGHENCKLNNQEAATATISEFSGFLVFLVAFGGGMLLTAQGYTTVGNVTAIVQLVNYVVLPINELGLLFTRFQSAQTILQQPLNTHNGSERHFSPGLGVTAGDIYLSPGADPDFKKSHSALYTGA